MRVVEVIITFLTSLLLVLTYLAIAGLVFTFIWNSGVHEVFGLSDISSWQGIGVLALIYLSSISAASTKK